mgnify:CR=1 FL=1
MQNSEPACRQVQNFVNYLRMSFIPLRKTLQQETNSKTPLKMQVEASLVLENAGNVLVEIFGKEKAYHIRPLFLKHRTLTLACTNTIMAQEIRENQNTIVSKINEKLGKKEVDSIRYLI